MVISINLTPADRLIIAADFKPAANQGASWVRDQVCRLADELAGLQICLKVNSALRACGLQLLKEIHERGLRSFADLKLSDIPETVETDGVLCGTVRPAFLTVLCSTGSVALQRLVDTLPNTEILGVTVLTSLDDSSTQRMYGCDALEAVVRLAHIGVSGGLRGFVSSAREVDVLISHLGRQQYSYITPGIRPAWAMVRADDQSRIATPRQALLSGATRLIIGRPITQAVDRRAAAERTLEEIARFQP